MTSLAAGARGDGTGEGRCTQRARARAASGVHLCNDVTASSFSSRRRRCLPRSFSAIRYSKISRRQMKLLFSLSNFSPCKILREEKGSMNFILLRSVISNFVKFNVITIITFMPRLKDIHNTCIHVRCYSGIKTFFYDLAK